MLECYLGQGFSYSFNKFFDKDQKTFKINLVNQNNDLPLQSEIF